MNHIKIIIEALKRKKASVIKPINQHEQCSNCGYDHGIDMKSWNYCLQCGYRFCSLFTHMKIFFKYHFKRGVAL